MTETELRTFLAIVETGSLVRASQVLHVTQSTVTARLKALEAELGQVLINRNRSGATLTAAGMRLHRYADTITDLWRQARQETALPDGMSSVCNLACEVDLWPGLGEVLFARLEARHPETALSIWLGAQGDVTGWLNDGRSDLALTTRAATSERQDLLELAPDRLVLVATRPDVPMAFGPDYIFVEGGPGFGRDHAAAFAEEPPARLSFGNATLGHAHLLRHGGAAYLPERLIGADLAAGRLYPVADAPVFTRRLYLTSNRSAQAAWPWFGGIAGLLPEGAVP